MVRGPITVECSYWPREIESCSLHPNPATPYFLFLPATVYKVIYFSQEGSMIIGGKEVMLQPSSQEKRDSENEANTHDVTPFNRNINYGHDYIIPKCKFIKSKEIQ